MAEKVIFDCYWPYLEGDIYSAYLHCLKQCHALSSEVEYTLYQCDRGNAELRDLLDLEQPFSDSLLGIQRFMAAHSALPQDMGGSIECRLRGLGTKSWLLISFTRYACFTTLGSAKLDSLFYGSNTESNRDTLFRFLKSLCESSEFRNLWTWDKAFFAGDPYFLYRPTSFLKEVEKPVLDAESMKEARACANHIQRALSRKEIIKVVEGFGSSVTWISDDRVVIDFNPLLRPRSTAFEALRAINEFAEKTPGHFN